MTSNCSGIGESKSETEAHSTWRVGVHTSIAGSLERAAEHAQAIGGNSLQIFSSSPRMWRTRDFPAEEISAFARLRAQFNLKPLVIHCNYLINLASPDPVLRGRSTEAFTGEIQRAAAMKAEYLVLHPGSFREGSPEHGIRDLTTAMRKAVRQAEPNGVTILVENMCGQGSVLGGTFEQLREILDRLEGLPVAACIDTAHCYGAGMDLSGDAGLTATVTALERTVGWQRVPLIHANDSRARLGSHLDRHEHIGRGGIGRAGFRRIVNHPVLRDKVFILETPVEEDGDDRRNLEAIRGMRAEAARKQPRRGSSLQRRLSPKAATQNPVRKAAR